MGFQHTENTAVEAAILMSLSQVLYQASLNQFLQQLTEKKDMKLELLCWKMDCRWHHKISLDNFAQ